MHSRQLLPWNWFKKEEEHSVSSNNRPVVSNNAGLNLHPLMRIQQQMDRLFDDLWGQDALGLQHGIKPDFRSGLNRLEQSIENNAILRPSLDISENDEGYRIQVEVPGVSQKDLNVELDGDVLTISGEKSQTKEEKSENYHQVERSFGRFERVLCLPANADKEHMNAKFKDGVLTIVFAKQALPAGQSPKRVEISAG